MTQTPSASRRMSRRSVLITAIPAIALAALVVLATRPIGPHQPGAAGPSSGDGGTVGIAIGDRAPDFVHADGKPALVGLDHRPIRLADFAGHPLWIVFWATWCTPCQEEAADIQAEYSSHASSGLAVLAIDVQDPDSAVRDFISEHKVDYPVAIDSTAAVQSLFGGWALPVHYFLDGSGRIRDRYIGQLSRDGMDQRLASIIGSGGSALSR